MTQKDVYVNFDLFLILAGQGIEYENIKVFDMDTFPGLQEIYMNSNTQLKCTSFNVNSENLNACTELILLNIPDHFDKKSVTCLLNSIIQLKITTKIPFSQTDWCVYLISFDSNQLTYLCKIIIRHQLVSTSWKFFSYSIGLDTACVDTFVYNTFDLQRKNYIHSQLIK